jgi:hypothetical protein
LIAAAEAAHAGPPDHPMFVRGPGPHAKNVQPGHLTTWTFTWMYNGQKYSARLAGTNPKNGTATTVPTYVIPIALKYGNTEENPVSRYRDGKSVIDYTLASPVLRSEVDFVQGGTDLGTTQYADAVQRGAFWGFGVEQHPGYHVLLGKPKLQKLITLDIPEDKGEVGTPFGISVVEADINWFDNQIQPILAKLPPNSLGIFVTTQSYLTTGGQCCIGGYHNYDGKHFYLDATFIRQSGTFGQDVSALSTEVGEWIDDPLTTNGSLCLDGEVFGGPAGGGPGRPPYGQYPYKVRGFTYHLQDLLFPPYFGAPPGTSVNGWFSFQNIQVGVCEQQLTR